LTSQKGFDLLAEIIPELMVEAFRLLFWVPVIESKIDFKRQKERYLQQLACV
jgi:glycogen synthase